MAVKQFYLRFGSGSPAAYTGLAPSFTVWRNVAGTTTPPAITEMSSTGIYGFTYDCTGGSGTIAFVCDGVTTSLTSQDRYVFGSIDIVQFFDQVGQSLSALGTTNVALGTTNVALGTTAVALGVTNVFLGTGIGTTLIATGATLVAIGNTGNALGTTNVAIGTSNIALGTTAVYLAGLGSTAAAIGNTLSALIGTTSSLIGSSAADPTTVFGFLKRCQEDLEGDSSYTKTSGVFVMTDRTGATTLASKTISDTGTAITKT